MLSAHFDTKKKEIFYLSKTIFILSFHEFYCRRRQQLKFASIFQGQRQFLVTTRLSLFCHSSRVPIFLFTRRKVNFNFSPHSLRSAILFHEKKVNISSCWKRKSLFSLFSRSRNTKRQTFFHIPAEIFPRTGHISLPSVTGAGSTEPRLAVNFFTPL